MAFTIYFFYPETRGHTLEQMAVVFDGAEAEGRVVAGGLVVRAGSGVGGEKGGVGVERVWGEEA